MFRRLITRKKIKNIEYKIEYLNNRVLICEGELNTIYVCGAIWGCFAIGSIFIKDIFECNK